MGTAGGGGVFVSYRREETSHFAGRLADRLKNHFSAEQVFMDVETIEPGVDFAEAIFRAVDACMVLVAVIGPRWLAAADKQGRRRLDDPDDLVRLEIGTALTRGVRVIPVLAEGAVMPDRTDLPDSLAGLARRHALRIRHESFGEDAGRLVAAIERVLAAAPVAVAHSADSAESPSNAPARRTDVKEGSGTARNDPGRAAQLLGDVERIANSIAAERIANSITREYAKAGALSGVAAAVAAADPDRAERIANSITSKSAKVKALGAIARMLAA